MSICPMSGLPCPSDRSKKCRFCSRTGENRQGEEEKGSGGVSDQTDSLSPNLPVSLASAELQDLAQQHPEEAIERWYVISDEEREYHEEIVRMCDAAEKRLRGEPLTEEEARPCNPKHEGSILQYFLATLQELIPGHLKPENQFRCTGCGG
jgi:hypothetical protein